MQHHENTNNMNNGHAIDPTTRTVHETEITTTSTEERTAREDTTPIPKLNVNENPDYIALKSTLSLLESQRKQSTKDILKLDLLKTEALSNPQMFINNLQTNSHKIPVMQKIVQVPKIDMKKYPVGNSNVVNDEDGNEEKDPMFKETRLFDQQQEKE